MRDAVEQLDEIPFSGVIATMLLKKECVDCLEILNICAKINSLEGYFDVDISDHGIDELLCCVTYDKDYNFMLKEGLDYSSVLAGGITVHDFLESKSLSKEIRGLLFGEVFDLETSFEPKVVEGHEIEGHEIVNYWTIFHGFKNKCLGRFKWFARPKRPI